MRLLPVALGAALSAYSPALSAEGGAAPTGDAAPTGEAAPAEGPRYELMVVGVYRPLDLEGRTVVEPREVYLQSVGVPEGPLSALIGRDLEVIRRAPVPAAVPMTGTTVPDAGIPAPVEAPAAARQATTTPAVAAGPEASSEADITRPSVEPLPVPRVPTPVGRLQVTAVRGDVVVARVVHDGVDSTMHPEAEKPDGRVDLPAILAGDIARYVQPPPPPAPPPALSPDEKAQLDAEKKRLEEDDARRKARPKAYERPVMRWKL